MLTQPIGVQATRRRPALLDRRVKKPIFAASVSRRLARDSMPTIGTSSAVAKLVDQMAGGRDVTMVGTAAPPADLINRHRYLPLDGATYGALATALPPLNDFTMIWVTHKVATQTGALLGREGNAQPYIRQNSRTQWIIRSDTSAAVTLTTPTLDRAVNCMVLRRSGSNASLRANSQNVATGVCAGAFSNLDRLFRNQTGNMFAGIFLEVIIFDQYLADDDPDLLAIETDIAAAYPRVCYLSKAGSGTGSGVNEANEYNNPNDWTNAVEPAGNGNGGFALSFKRGEVWEDTNLILAQANQAGTAANPNRLQSHGDRSLPRACLRGSKQVTAWTQVSGSVYAAPFAYAAFGRAYILNPGYSAKALADATVNAVAASLGLGTKTCDDVGAVALAWNQAATSALQQPNFAAADALVTPLNVAASSAVAIGECYWDSGTSTLYVNTGQDPTTQNIWASKRTNGSDRGLQFARDWWVGDDAVDVEMWAEDGIAFSGSNVTLRRFNSVLNAGDNWGGKGGSNHLFEDFVLAWSGIIFKSYSGSNGDDMSGHGSCTGAGNRGLLYHAQKAGVGHERGTSYTHDLVLFFRNNNNIRCSDQNGTNGVLGLTRCGGALAADDTGPMVDLATTAAFTMYLTDCAFVGNNAAPDNRGAVMKAGAVNTVTLTNVRWKGFTTNVVNQSTGGTIIQA